MEKVLVIGKNGNLGSELVRQLGSAVVAWDREELDITKREEVIRKIAELKPSVVFNCAAFNNVDAAEENVDAANLLNGYAPGFLAEACKKIDAVLVHFSSDYVFNGQSKDGYNEETAPDPINRYGESKFLGEQEVARHTDKYYIVRTSWLFGKKGPGEAAKLSFVDTMLELAKTKPELKVVDDEESRPTYITDLAQGVIGLIGLDRTDMTDRSYGTYHITNSGNASWYELAKEAFRIRGITTPIIPVPGSTFPRAAKRPRYGFLNNTKLPKLRPWQEALTEYLHSMEK